MLGDDAADILVRLLALLLNLVSGPNAARPNARSIPFVLYDESGHIKDDVCPRGVNHVVLSDDPRALLTAVKALAD